MEWREHEGIYTTHHCCHDQCSNIVSLGKVALGSYFPELIPDCAARSSYFPRLGASLVPSLLSANLRAAFQLANAGIDYSIMPNYPSVWKVLVGVRRRLFVSLDGKIESPPQVSCPRTQHRGPAVDRLIRSLTY